MKIISPQICKLPDGRSLAYAGYGDPQGFPVFFFHGTPGSHIDWELFDVEDTASRLGVRLIAVDRPGIGLSDYQSGRRFLDWPADLAALADRLALERFSVLGFSSGGAYALVCPLKIPERLVRVGVLNGDGPYEQPGIVEGIELMVFHLLSLSSSAPGLFRQTLTFGRLDCCSHSGFLPGCFPDAPSPGRPGLICQALREAGIACYPARSSA